MNQVRVGVGLYILNEKNELLLGLRKSPHGSGNWCPPGGHLEFGESFEQAGVREAMEETDLVVDPKDVQILGCTNDIYQETNKHYVTIHMLTRKFYGEIKVNELEKFEKWQWFSLPNLPTNLFLSAYNFLKNNPFK